MEWLRRTFDRSPEKEKPVEYRVGQRTLLPAHFMVEKGFVTDRQCPAPQGGSNPRAGIVEHIVDAETCSAAVLCTRCDFWTVALPLSDGGVIFAGDQDVADLPPGQKRRRFPV